jgi:hypothetical protein
MGVTKGCANLDTVHVQKNHFADVELPEARLVSFIYLELITSKVPEGYKNRCTTQLAQRKKTKQKTNPHHQTPSLMNRTPPSTRSGEAPFQKCFDFSHIRWSVAANTLVSDAPRAPLTLDRNWARSTLLLATYPTPLSHTPLLHPWSRMPMAPEASLHTGRLTQWWLSNLISFRLDCMANEWNYSTNSSFELNYFCGVCINISKLRNQAIDSLSSDI